MIFNCIFKEWDTTPLGFVAPYRLGRIGADPTAGGRGVPGQHLHDDLLEALASRGTSPVGGFVVVWQCDGSSAAEFVVTWTSLGSNGDDSSGHSIQGQRYVLPLFADGFESGDLSAWSHSVP